MTVRLDFCKRQIQKVAADDKNKWIKWLQLTTRLICLGVTLIYSRWRREDLETMRMSHLGRLPSTALSTRPTVWAPGVTSRTRPGLFSAYISTSMFYWISCHVDSLVKCLTSVLLPSFIRSISEPEMKVFGAKRYNYCSTTMSKQLALEWNAFVSNLFLFWLFGLDLTDRFCCTDIICYTETEKTPVHRRVILKRVYRSDRSNTREAHQTTRNPHQYQPSTKQPNANHPSKNLHQIPSLAKRPRPST